MFLYKWPELFCHGRERERAKNLNFPDPAISYFKQLVYNSMISGIANHTNLYSTQKDPHKLIDVSKIEIEHFIGTLIFMSIYGLPKCTGELKRVFHDLQM